MGLPLERFPDWPAAMDWETALAYTSLAEAELRRHEREGTVRFLAVGANGKKVAPREQLDRVLAKVWAGAAPLSKDMDFGDD